MPYLTIGELAKKAAISKVTIRFYERCGLLPDIIRSPAGYRQYPETLIPRLYFIKNAKSVGFSLEEIKELFSLQSQLATTRHIRQHVLEKWKLTQGKLLTLQKIAATLEHMLFACDGKVPLNECPILETLYSDDIQQCLPLAPFEEPFK